MINFFTQHIFFLSSLLFFILWIILFIINKKNRGQMLVISLSTMILGCFVEQMHFTDWWQPNFIFNSYIKIEDILFGFSVGGVISGIYSLVKNQIKYKTSIPLRLSTKFFLLALSICLLFVLFYIFNISSFYSSVVALLIPVIFIYYKNKKLLYRVCLTGIIITCIAFLGYLFAIYINPTFVKDTYLLDHLSGILFFGIPIEELIWFFFAGMGISAFQEIIFNP